MRPRIGVRWWLLAAVYDVLNAVTAPLRPRPCCGDTSCDDDHRDPRYRG